jgi:transcription elongation factor GreB
MSKAFTKESDADDDDLGEEDPSLAVPQGFKNYITPGGAKKLREELKTLLNVTRPEMVKTVAWAASNGDRSENGDYIYGKRRLREIDRRIRFLQKRLDIAEIVDPTQQSPGQVLFGATVTVADVEEKKRVYSIVGIDETEVKQGRVSWISPIAKALLNSKIGDVVTLRTPRGDEDLEVTEIRYLPLDPL